MDTLMPHPLCQVDDEDTDLMVFGTLSWIGNLFAVCKWMDAICPLYRYCCGRLDQAMLPNTERGCIITLFVLRMKLPEYG